MRKALLTTAVAVSLLLAAPAFGHAAERVNVANSSIDWEISPSASVVDAAPGNVWDCPEQEYHRNVYDCATEYYYQRPNGIAGTRRFLVSGYVTWTGVHVNPYGPGLFGTPQTHTFHAYSWVRHWHRDPNRCLAAWPGVRGYVVSNMPCGDVADAIWHGDRRIGYISGTGTGDWPWLYSFPCRRRADWTTCSNRVGDSYKYRGAFPYKRP